MRTRDSAEHDALASSEEVECERRCERVLAAIQDRTLPLSLADLTDAVTDESGTSSTRSTPRDVDVDRVQIQLHHVDLPRLDERGALAYDHARNVVSECFENESK